MKALASPQLSTIFGFEGPTFLFHLRLGLKMNNGETCVAFYWSFDVKFLEIFVSQQENIERKSFSGSLLRLCTTFIRDLLEAEK